ncbi:carbohydrate kinase family protein [Streptomyces microflavus]|uniref:carbohydrate kinase family protein n=1 Tax=Streptomyces microflavus TaxID=1919 RepID=UPI00330562BD
MRPVPTQERAAEGEQAPGSYQELTSPTISAALQAERPEPSEDPSQLTTIFVVGGVAVDIVTTLPRAVRPGMFVQATSTIERVGGCAVNIASGLTDAGCPCVIVGCAGTDARGDWLRAELSDKGMDARLRSVSGPTPLSLIMVEPSGERTIVGLTEDLFSHIDMASINLRQHDAVVLPQWRPGLAHCLEQAKAAGCRTVVGLRALQDPASPSADLAIGSIAEVADRSTLTSQLHRFGAVVVTDGARGSEAHLPDGRTLVQPAVAASPVDATGAGDAYLAGFVHQWMSGASLPQAMAVAAAWGALATESHTSVPPPWSGVLPRLDAAE